MNINFLNELLSPKESYGADVGASMLKLVHLKKTGKQNYTLMSLGMLEADLLSGNAVAVNRTKAYLNECGMAGRRVALNIESPTLRIRRMDLPDMPSSDTKVAIRWNFREHVDGAIEKFNVSYTTVEKYKEGGRRAMIAYAVSKDDVNKLASVVKQTELRVGSVEPTATALLAAFDMNVKWENNKNYVLIDLGQKTGNFVAMSDGALLFSRPLPQINGEYITKSISSRLGLTKEQSEAALKGYLGVNGNGKDLKPEMLTEIKLSVESFLGQMVLEVQRSIDAFCLMYKLDKVDQIYFCGGLSLIPNLCQYVSKNLGIETNLFNPFEKIEVASQDIIITNPQLYAVAVGLAIPQGK